MKSLKQSLKSTTCTGALHNPESHMHEHGAVVQRDEQDGWNPLQEKYIWVIVKYV